MNTKLSKCFLAGIVGCFAFTLSAGEELLSAQTNASWVTPHWRKFDKMDEFLSIKGWVDIHTKRSFEVDPKAEYELSGMFRTPGDQKELTRFEFGFDPIGADGNPIPPQNVFHVPGTDTVLAAPANPGDKTVKVKKAGKWWNSAYVAFHAKPDFSDLPNQDAVFYSSVQTDGDALILSLKEPLRKAYPAGCPVRNQYQNRLWTVSRFQKAPHEWTKFSGKIKGVNLTATSNNQWWPGTERAQVFLIIPEKVALEFKDVVVTKISE